MKNIYAENSMSRNKWDVSLAIALCNYNKMPLRNMTFTKEEIMFRFPIDNNNLISIEGIDDEDIKNDLKEYIENKVKPIKKKKTDPIQPGQIVYIKNDKTIPQGTNLAYLQKHRGPMLVIKSIPERKQVVVRQIDSNKYFYVSTENLIPIKLAHQIPTILNDITEKQIFNEIKRANTDLPENKILIDNDLDEIPTDLKKYN